VNPWFCGIDPGTSRKKGRSKRGRDGGRNGEEGRIERIEGLREKGRREGKGKEGKGREGKEKDNLPTLNSHLIKTVRF
jgi:hypothetical protein